MIKWDKLPQDIRNEEVYKYYCILEKKKASMVAKRLFDFFVAILLLMLLCPVMVVIAIAVVTTSRGPVFFCQNRITTYGKSFRIFKFRTMINNAEVIGENITLKNDFRITKVGKVIRKVRLDELPQLFNIIVGEMSFIGTRPEVKKYTDLYTDEMKATLLMPAGVSSLASITFRNEDQYFTGSDEIDKIYVRDVLPQKMKYNLEYIERFSVLYDIKLMFQTVFMILKR